MNLAIYTDGACSKNGQVGAVGGWAYVAVLCAPNGGDPLDGTILKQEYGRVEGATNQQMEITAVINAVKCANKHPQFFYYSIYSDSAYCINAINDGWIDNWRSNGWLTSKKEPVKNRELWEELYSLYSTNSKLVFQKVKGHSGNKWNEIVDRMAVGARDNKLSF